MTIKRERDADVFEMRDLLEEVEADIEIARRHGHLDARSIAALERTAADLRFEIASSAGEAK